jgi:hypothetical protein
MTAGTDIRLALFLLLLIVGGVLLSSIGKWARSQHHGFPRKPIRRHRNWFVDYWLHAKNVRSSREIWFGPLPVLLEVPLKIIAWLVIIAIIAGLIFLISFSILDH